MVLEYLQRTESNLLERISPMFLTPLGYVYIKALLYACATSSPMQQVVAPDKPKLEYRPNQQNESTKSLDRLLQLYFCSSNNNIKVVLSLIYT